VKSLVLLLLPAAAWAFDSKINTGQDLHGRAAARAIYNAEHRPILELALANAGVPGASQWQAPYRIVVPTLETAMPDLAAEPYTLIPRDPASATRLRARFFIPTQFAELPDFSYSLHDWWTGNETCPPNGTGNPMGVGANDECYLFGGWMGTLNSTHFPPQSNRMWDHYHTLAMGIGGQCQSYAAAMGYPPNQAGPVPAYLQNTLDCGADGLCPGDAGYSVWDIGEGDGIDDFLQQCQIVQLMLESVGQHFFQDTWSAGHMWQRWGGPTPTQIPNLSRGLAVAMTSGMIHGSKAVTTINDRMCAGSEFRYAWGAGLGGSILLPDDGPAYTGFSEYEAVGDLFLADLNAGGGWIFTAGLPRYWNTSYQNTTMYDCLEKSVRETYIAGARIYGPEQSWSSTIGNVRSGLCHDARANNERMYDGSHLDIAATSLDINSTVVWGTIVAKSGLGAGDALSLKAQLTAIDTKLWLGSIADPSGFDASTNTQKWSMGTLLGLSDNANPVNNVLPGYADPPAPWDGLDAAGAADSREEELITAFHRAFSPAWCDRDRMGFDDMNDLRRRCQGLGTYSGLDPQAKETSCQLCEEFSARHIRIGCSEDDYQTDREPLCARVADPADVDFLYLDLDPADPLAQDAGLAAGHYCRSNQPQFGPCVDAYLFGDYEVSYCTTYYFPPWIYQCISCPACLPVGTALAIIDSPYPEDELHIQWTTLGGGGYFTASDQAESPFVFDLLVPYYCGVEAVGGASVQVEVWDPYWASSGTDFAYGESSCYGTW
jgi:hypothetical protein